MHAHGTPRMPMWAKFLPDSAITNRGQYIRWNRTKRIDLEKIARRCTFTQV